MENFLISKISFNNFLWSFEEHCYGNNTVSGCDGGNWTRNMAMYTWRLSPLSYGSEVSTIKESNPEPNQAFLKANTKRNSFRFTTLHRDYSIFLLEKSLRWDQEVRSLKYFNAPSWHFFEYLCTKLTQFGPETDSVHSDRVHNRSEAVYMR